MSSGSVSRPTFRASFLAQFRRPHGFAGRAVGHLMNFKNAKRSRWALGLLAPREGERVIEVGFGGGADVARLLAAVGERGRVAGADLSETMVSTVARRHRAAVRDGRADLRLAGADALPFADGAFDAAYSVNCAQFWPDLTAGLRELLRVVRPGGRAVVAVQPRQQGATEADSERWRAALSEAACAAGWSVEESTLGTTVPPAAAVRLCNGAPNMRRSA